MAEIEFEPISSHRCADCGLIWEEDPKIVKAGYNNVCPRCGHLNEEEGTNDNATRAD